MEIIDLNITQTNQSLVKKEFSAAELCRVYLNKIKKENEKIFAFLTVTEDAALFQAKEVDDLIAKGEKIPLLAGIPSAIKDVILIKKIRCTAGSKILENYIAPYDATVIKKLKENKVVFLGKTNLDEFAMGTSTEHSAFGPTKNPYDLERVPGGSSGGSAAAVAAKQCLFSLGSDSGGSVRQPASFCGVVGLKPTYGAVSRYGLIAFASSLDQIGPLAKNVSDAKIVFEAIKGKDSLDSTSVEIPDAPNVQNIKLGLPKEYFTKGIDPETEKVVKEAVKKYERAGFKIEEISLPHTEYGVAAYYIIAPSEASANLARYDGVKYGYSEKENNLMDAYLKTRGRGFGEEVKRRIILGTFALSSGYYDAYYLRAEKVRALIKQDFEKAFKKVDVILTPTSPTTAFKLKENIDDPLSLYLADIFTVAANLAGNPALSIPCGKANGLPVGLQLIGRMFEEETILKTGEIFEQWKT